MIGKIDDVSVRVTQDELTRFDRQLPIVGEVPTERKRQPVARDAEPMPSGVTRWPPPRPDGFELRRVAPGRIMQAVQALESPPDSGFRSGDAAPADRLFAVWFRVLDWLGTRALTMCEMNNLLGAQAAGQPVKGEARFVEIIGQIDKADMGLESFDELYKFTGALSTDGSAAQQPPIFGLLRAGEAGAFVESTDQTPDEHDNVVLADVAVLKEYFVADLLPTPVLTPAAVFWSRVTPQLSQAPVEIIVGLVSSFSDSDDWREERKHADALTFQPAPVTAPVPVSAQRPAAGVVAAGASRAHRSRSAAVSVSRMTADVQLAQVLHRYLKLDRAGARVDVGDPNAKLDLVDAYRLYRQMVNTRELTSRQTVESWLVDWAVPSAP